MINQTANGKKFIHQFIYSGGKKSKHRRIVGLVVATGKRKVGWSLCRVKDARDAQGNVLIKADVFDEQRAFEMALGRANNNPVKDVEAVPHTVRRVVAHFKDVRSVKYFDPKKKKTKKKVS